MPNKSSSSCENSFQLSKVSIAYLGKVALQTMGGCNSSQTYWSLKNSKVLPSTAVKIRAWSEKNLRRGKTTPVNLDAIMANIIVGRGKREIFEPSYHQVPGWQIDIRMIKPISSVRPDLPSMCWIFCEGRRRLTQINHSPSTSCINILYAPCITYLFAHVIYCCILLYIVIYCYILLDIVIYCYKLLYIVIYCYKYVYI